jgi:hypothetical protein
MTKVGAGPIPPVQIYVWKNRVQTSERIKANGKKQLI